MSTTALPVGLILIGLIAWPDDRPRQSERDRQEVRVDAALEALRGLGRDYPRSNGALGGVMSGHGAIQASSQR